MNPKKRPSSRCWQLRCGTKNVSKISSWFHGINIPSLVQSVLKWTYIPKISIYVCCKMRWQYSITRLIAYNSGPSSKNTRLGLPSSQNQALFVCVIPQSLSYVHFVSASDININELTQLQPTSTWIELNEVIPLHAMEAHEVRGGIAPTQT
jgi:hypothetical protein